MGSSNPVRTVARLSAAIATGGLSEVGGRNSAFNQVTGETRLKRAERDAAGKLAAANSAAVEEARKAAIADESVRAQAEEARKRTIFAGGNIEQNIFRKTLGAGTGSTTLG